jgi:hypothetical protein
MICTGGQAGNHNNFPLYFSSSDGATWNGSPEPYAAQLSDIIPAIEGHSNFGSGDFNGANVLLQDNGSWVLYFEDWNDTGKLYRAYLKAGMITLISYLPCAFMCLHSIMSLIWDCPPFSMLFRRPTNSVRCPVFLASDLR